MTLTICHCTKWYTEMFWDILRNLVDFQQILFFLRYMKTHPDIPQYIEISVLLLGYPIQFQIYVYDEISGQFFWWDILLLPSSNISNSFEISQSNSRHTTVYWDTCVTFKDILFNFRYLDILWEIQRVFCSIFWV